MSRLLHLLPALLLVLALTPAVAGIEPEMAANDELAAENLNPALTPEDIESSFAQLRQLVSDLQLSGDLSPAGAEQLELLIGGLLGSLTYRLTAFSGDTDDYGGYGTGGAPGEQVTYYSEITPARQVTLFTNPETASTGETKLANELSVWIDEAGNVFVMGAADDTNATRQLSLKQGWEGDFDKLNGQIQKMLAEFMEEHAAETPSEPDVVPPGAPL